MPPHDHGKIFALKRTQFFGEFEEPELRALAELAVERLLARENSVR